MTRWLSPSACTCALALAQFVLRDKKRTHQVGVVSADHLELPEAVADLDAIALKLCCHGCLLFLLLLPLLLIRVKINCYRFLLLHPLKV